MVGSKSNIIMIVVVFDGHNLYSLGLGFPLWLLLGFTGMQSFFAHQDIRFTISMITATNKAL